MTFPRHVGFDDFILNVCIIIISHLELFSSWKGKFYRFNIISFKNPNFYYVFHFLSGWMDGHFALALCDLFS